MAHEPGCMDVGRPDFDGLAGLFGARFWCIAAQDPQLAARLGAQARQHVQQSFSRAAFGEKLDAIVRSLANGSRAE